MADEAKARRRAVAQEVSGIVAADGYDVKDTRAWEVKPGVFRCEIVTAEGQSNQYGLFRLAEDGTVTAVGS
jgi:hypothetical protein